MCSISDYLSFNSGLWRLTLRLDADFRFALLPKSDTILVTRRTMESSPIIFRLPEKVAATERS